MGRINKIAGQTKRLALHATIEAARADELGKAFANVASKVEMVAEEATKAIEEILGKGAPIRKIS